MNTEETNDPWKLLQELYDAASGINPYSNMDETEFGKVVTKTRMALKQHDLERSSNES